MAILPRRLKASLSFSLAVTLWAISSPASAGELSRGWKSATLDISSETLDEIIAENSHQVEHFSIVEESKYDSLNDSYHLTRYFEGRFPFSDTLGSFEDDDIKCFYELGEQTCQFSGFRKVTVAGDIFDLEAVRKITFWQDLSSPTQDVFIVEYVFKDEEQHASRLAEHTSKHGEPSEILLGRYSYLASTLRWSDDLTYVLLCETYPARRPDSSDRYSIVFGDKKRVRIAQEEMNRLLSKAANKVNRMPAKQGSLEVQGLSLDESRSSFAMERLEGLNYAAWNWPIIEQHIYPKKYFDRFENESVKPYFDVVYRYFFRRRQTLESANCRRLIGSKSALWRVPFHERLADCPGIFPSAQEMESLSSSDFETYKAILHWYAHGFGIPYPVFEIVVYNPTDDEVLITHLSYQLEYIDTLLPNIIDDPPMSPFVHILDVRSAKPQTHALEPIIAVPAGRHSSFRVKLKSTAGIGQICKISMSIVARTGAREEMISDDKLVFATVLSSMSKRIHQ